MSEEPTPTDRDDDPDAEPAFESEFEFDADSWDELEEEEASKLLKGLEALIPGILKRSIVAGLSHAAAGEEGLRSAVTDKNIPKEAVGFILSQADSTRRELLRIVSREVRLFLENMDFGGEIAKILTTLSFEIRTEVRFIANDEAVKPEIRNRVKLKRARRDGTQETVSEFDEETASEEPPPKTANAKPPERRRRRKRWTRATRDSDSE